MALDVFAIPGIGGDASLYDRVAAELAPAIRLTGVDLPGYGREPVARQQYGFGDLARALAERADGAGIARLHLLGHSIGGMVAQEFALAYPMRTASLVLSGTTSSFGSADGSFQQKFLAERLAPLDGGQTMAELAATFVPALIGSEADPAAAGLARTALAATDPQAYRMAIACLVTFNRRADLGRIACPVLLIAGKEDVNAPAKTMTRMAEAIPGARLAVLERTGHLAPYEKPIQFARLMREFYEEFFPREAAA
jgi:pimeloyl-ACP methyl ester carboxylesterase